MFQKLVNHNGDIGRLVEKGYAVAFDEGYLVIRDIPYLGKQGELLVGSIVAKLVFLDKEKIRQDDHQIYFAGSSPYGLNGKLIPDLGDRPAKIPLSKSFDDVIVQRSFSNKPKRTGGFADFFEKVESYVAIISGPAIEKHDKSPFTFRTQEIECDSVFKFHDTMTSRAEIGDLSSKLKDDVIAIIGLGGTGGFLVDLLVRTPGREIRLFDLDAFHVHNAYRSPGTLDESELGKPKAELYKARYDNFRTGIEADAKFIDATSSEDLHDVTFAFVCVDKGPSRAGIFEVLLENQIPFIDVGLGLARRGGPLGGMARVTYYSQEKGRELRDMQLAELNETPDDLYRSSIQTGELNALNACLAVIRFKQIRGFYSADESIDHMLFNISDFSITSESKMGESDDSEEG